MHQFTPIPEEQYINNPGYLKLDLMLRGVIVDPSFFKAQIVLNDYKLGPQVFGNVDLILPQETYVSVPYQENFVQSSPYKLRQIRERHYLATAQESIPVKVIVHPRFYNQKVNEHTSIGDVAHCHGNYVSIALGGHRYLQPHIVQHGTNEKGQERVISVDETIAVLERIRKDQKMDVVTLSSWNAHDEDGGALQIEPYIRTIKSSFNVLLFVEVHLPATPGWIDRTYAMGADSVCYHLGNLCSHGHDDQNHHRDSAEDIQLLEHAVSIFPQGTVLSHITMGSRPYKDVMADIETLTKCRVLPILTIENQQVIFDKHLQTSDLAAMFGFVYNMAKKKKIKMNWFSKLAPFIAPIEGRYFSGDSPKFKLAVMNFYQSRLFGGSISLGLSNLRRRLRVKEK